VLLQFLINKTWKKVHDIHEMNIINAIKNKSKVEHNHVLSSPGVYYGNVSTNDERTNATKRKTKDKSTKGAKWKFY